MRYKVVIYGESAKTRAEIAQLAGAVLTADPNGVKIYELDPVQEELRRTRRELADKAGELVALQEQLEKLQKEKALQG